MRQIVLDTETTGLDPEQGHRVIEIGAVELIDRKITGNHFHEYVRPDRDIDDAAYDIHGLSSEFLESKPAFGEIAERFFAYVEGAELIIHNAPFDVGFLDYEISLLDNEPPMAERCTITDTLAMARQARPGQANSLDALCRHYQIDNSARELHGALLDAELLADVYLAMTGGQTSMFGTEQEPGATGEIVRLRLPADRRPTPVIRATEAELAQHEEYLNGLDKTCEEGPLWRRL